jgi:hypothetical protein
MIDLLKSLLPAFEFDAWGGGAMERDRLSGDDHEVSGRMLAIEWLGFHVEFAIGRVHSV